MRHDSADSSFEVLSERLARLSVRNSSGLFGLTRDSVLLNHRLGLTEAPLYHVMQAFSPDDGWRVTPEPAARFVDSLAPAPAIDPLYEAWAVGSRANHGHQLVGVLPVGRYLLVRSARPSLAASRVLLGNERVPATPNMRVLRDLEPYYACVIGSDPAAPPDLSQPLLSLTVLDYVGATWMQGCIFFPFAAPASDDPGPTRDLLLIIPEEGELVLDNAFSQRPETRAKRAWRDRQAAELADWLAEAP